MALKKSSVTFPVSNNPEVLAQVLSDAGNIPNNRLPLLLYRKVIETAEPGPELFENLFRAHDWRGSWRNGIYDYHHYHSTSHEVLGVFSGSAKVQLGGENGIVYEVHPGDVLVIPAGVAHKNLGSSKDFGVVGAYPEGMDWDMNYGKPGERPHVDQNIAKVPLPKTDPVCGANGPLLMRWGQNRNS
jgi:uncharacterized protein YjlB